jgi:hypothetical protein
MYSFHELLHCTPHALLQAREELQAFIAKVRTEESRDEEQHYWNTHQRARRLRDIKEWAERMKYGKEGRPVGVGEELDFG